MSKSNWKASSGWGAISDPTSVLSGRVLVASAGLTVENEDYLLQVVGTSTTIAIDHYSVLMDYAWPNFDEPHPMGSGAFGLISRSGNFQGDPQRAYDCYLGQINVEENKVKIIRRVNNEDTPIYSADLPNATLSRGVKHTLEFRTYGTSQVTLQMYVDNQIIANIGDTDAARLTSGYPGIQSKSGTVYADSFTLLQYTATGTTPADWTPNQISGLTLSGWWIGEEGVTVSGTSISAWTDQSVNSNDFGSSDPASQPQQTLEGVNNYNVVTFAGANRMNAADHTSLDLNADGLSMFVILNPSKFASAGATTGSIIAKSSSYVFETKSNAGFRYSNGTANADIEAVGTTGVYQLACVVTDVANEKDGNSGIFIDGTNVLSSTGTSFTVGADTTADLFTGRDGSTTTFLNSSIAEIVLIKGECDQEQRQLVEGYLAQKYATWPRLPSTHPYRNFAPTQS